MNEQDDWTRGAIKVVAHADGGWRVTRSLAAQGWPPVTMWRTEDEGEAHAVAASILSHRVASNRHRKLLSRSEAIPTNDPDFTTVAECRDGLTTVKLMRAGKEAMRYACGPCDWRTAYVAGKSCASGGTTGLPAPQRGQGLGRHVYDHAEKAAGLPLVPHGANLNVGCLSPIATTFWSRRIVARDVAGFDDSSAARRERAILCADRHVENDPRRLNDAYFAVAVATALGTRIEWSTLGNDTFVSAWGVMESGKVALPPGPVPRTVAERALGIHKPGRITTKSGAFDDLRKLLDDRLRRRCEDAPDWLAEQIVETTRKEKEASLEKAGHFLHDLDPTRFPKPVPRPYVDLASGLIEAAKAVRTSRLEPSMALR